MSCCLHRIGVERHAVLAADGADFGDRLNGADLVVGVHHTHQTGVRLNGSLHLLRRDASGFVHIQQGDGEALLLQLFQRVQNGVVLKSGRNDVLLSLSCPRPCSRAKRLIVGLAATGGEVDLPCLTAQTVRHVLPCLKQHLSGGLSHMVQAGRIPVELFKARQHGIQSRAAGLGGGGVVGVNLHAVSSFRTKPPSGRTVCCVYLRLSRSRFLELVFVGNICGFSSRFFCRQGKNLPKRRR